MAAKRRDKTSEKRLEGGDLRDRILEAALEMAEERSWTAVRLVDVAVRLDIPPDRVLEHYRDLNSLADAWFLRGWQAMLAPKGEGFDGLPAAERIETCMLAWFDAFSPHHRVTAEMLRGKLHLPHAHHWVPMVFDLSGTIQWLREAALLPASYGTRRAQMEEVGLTALFLATLATWCRDTSPDQERTRRVLRRRLERADRMMARIRGRRAPPDEADQEE